MIVMLRLLMPRYQDYNYDQMVMLTIDLEQQLQPGSFEFTIHRLIDQHIDLSVFDSHYANDVNGRPAYDPALLLKIILFAYSKGITSSREIAGKCETNIVFKALFCDLNPHYTTIADFVSGDPETITSIFEQV